MGSSFY
jgi:hypothetical protein